MVSVLPTGNPEEDRELIEDIHIQEAMMQVQELSKEERRRRNKNLILSLRRLKVNLTGAYIWMKANLHPSTYKPSWKTKTTSQVVGRRGSVEEQTKLRRQRPTPSSQGSPTASPC